MTDSADECYIDRPVDLTAKLPPFLERAVRADAKQIAAFKKKMRAGEGGS